MKFISSLLFYYFSLINQGFIIHGQNINPTNNEAFIQHEIATIKIIIDPEDLDYVLAPENENSDLEFPATFIYLSSLHIDTIQQVGFRLRGNTSRSAEKKSYKVSFNEFIVGQKFKGLEKMNLNGEHNDVSIMRSKIAHEILFESNNITSRVSYVKLYINESYMGLYLNVEHIDDEFIQKRFQGNDNGNLFKCNWGADLSYWGSNLNNYYNFYELKTNKDSNDYTSLINFIQILNNSNNEDFPCQIESVFDVNSFLKSCAFEILIGQWDGYIFNKNNYYLYQRPSDGKFIYISYDLDNTFGVDWFGINWENRNIYNWESNDARPLFNRLMQIDFYKEIFNLYLEQYLSNHFQSQTLIDRLNEIQDLIREAAHSDLYKSLDYGFSNEDFDEAITDAWGGHIPISLQDYISTRGFTAQFQINHMNVTDPCLLELENLNSNYELKIIRTTNILGQDIPAETKNCLKIITYQNGLNQIIYEAN